MSNIQPFVAMACRQGYGVGEAEAALAMLAARLAKRGIATHHYFCFRTGGSGGSGAGAELPSRPRLLLLFASADDALSFAQRRGLGTAPRLMTLTLPQALAALLQRPNIGALLVAAGDEEPGASATTLPAGERIERGDLIELLASLAQ